jgi:hypothetical protein
VARQTRAPAPGAHRLALAFALGLAFTPPGTAAEIDSVTGRGQALGDASEALDRRIDRALRAGVERANETGSPCDEAELYARIREAIASPFIGHRLAEELNAAEELDTRRIRLDDSIYRDLTLIDAVSVHLKGLSSLLRLGDHVVGVDKLGHFLVEGWSYFDIAYLRGEGIDAALDWGEKTERTYFGLYTTGIYSYADLAANFEGMRFWLRLVGGEPDPLRSGYFFNRPYVSCGTRLFSRERYWQVNRRVRLRTWASGSWDEGVNCSRYANAEIAAGVARRIEERELADAAHYACPIVADACVDARERYGELAGRLLHPECLAAEPVPGPWWWPF